MSSRHTQRFAIAATAIAVMLVALVGTPARSDAAPTITVTPSSGLLGPTIVTVDATGLAPNSTVYVHECSAANLCGYIAVAGADASGAVHLQKLVRTTFLAFPPSPPPTVDCTQVQCKVEAFNSPGTPVGTPISFAPNAALEAPPPTASPTTGLLDGQTVTIDVPSGWYNLGESVHVQQCDSSTLTNCVAASGVVSADAATGAVHVAATVRTTLVTASGSLTCTTACVLAVVGGSDTATFDLTSPRLPIPISFAPAVTTTTTTVGSTPTSTVTAVAVTPRFTG